MNSFLRILHLEDNASDADLLKAILSADGIACEMERVETRNDFIAAVKKGRYDLIISDYTLPGFDGLSALTLTQEICPEVPFMFVSGTIGEEVATESLRHGARDYVLKSRLSHVGAKIRRTLREAREQNLRKQAEQSLRESEQLFRSVWNNSRDGMRLTDEYGMVVAVNKAFCELAGLPAAALTGNAFWSAEIRDDESAVQDEYVRLFAARKIETQAQTRISFRSGRTIIAEIRNNFIEGGGQEPLVLTIVRDCTESFYAGQLIRQQAALLNCSQDAIWATNGANLLFCWNKRSEKLFGWNASEVVGKNPEGLLFRAGDPKIELARKTSHELGEWRGELTLLTRDGGEQVMESRWTAIKEGEGELASTSLLVVNTKITQKPEVTPIAEAKKTQASLPGHEAAKATPELILVIEDEEMVREIIERSLEFFGFRVLTARHGKEGLERFQAHMGEISMVITDMMMPVMDGPAAIEGIRKLDQEVRIVAISGMPIREELFRRAETKVHAFLAKPFPTDQLIGTVNRLLKKSV